jgi:hypothetical protein
VLQTPLLTAAEVEAALTKDRELIAGFDVADLFRQFVARLQTAMTGNLDEGHAHVNGKWLVDVWAPTLTGTSPERCREVWQEAVRLSGGWKDARDFWRRLLRR